MLHPFLSGEWSGGAMVLGKLPVPGRPTILITVRQGPIGLAVRAVGWLVVLFYVHGKHLRSCRDGQLT